jgi:hypothetical protein
MEMVIYKHIKDGRLYLLHEVEKDGKKSTMALPVRHDGKVIVDCNPKDFVIHSLDPK